MSKKIKLVGLENAQVGDEVEITAKDPSEKLVWDGKEVKKGTVTRVSNLKVSVRFNGFNGVNEFYRDGRAKSDFFEGCTLKLLSQVETFGLTYTNDSDLRETSVAMLYSFQYNEKEIKLLTEDYVLNKRVFVNSDMQGTLLKKKNRELGVHLDGDPDGKITYFPARHVYMEPMKPLPIAGKNKR